MVHLPLLQQLTSVLRAPRQFNTTLEILEDLRVLLHRVEGDKEEDQEIKLVHLIITNKLCPLLKRRHGKLMKLPVSLPRAWRVARSETTRVLTALYSARSATTLRSHQSLTCTSTFTHPRCASLIDARLQTYRPNGKKETPWTVDCLVRLDRMVVQVLLQPVEEDREG